jgi:hypothetical protein
VIATFQIRGKYGKYLLTCLPARRVLTPASGRSCLLKCSLCDNVQSVAPPRRLRLFRCRSDCAAILHIEDARLLIIIVSIPLDSYTSTVGCPYRIYAGRFSPFLPSPPPTLGYCLSLLSPPQPTGTALSTRRLKLAAKRTQTEWTLIHSPAQLLCKTDGTRAGSPSELTDTPSHGFPFGSGHSGHHDKVQGSSRQVRRVLGKEPSSSATPGRNTSRYSYL